MVNHRKKVREILSTKLKIETTEYTIERAHRVGKKNATGKPRSLVAKFNNFKVKENILRNKKGLKGSNIFVREDFSQKVLARRRDLLPKMHEERRKGNIAFLRYDKLVVYPDRRFQGQEYSTRSPLHSTPSSRGRGQTAWRSPASVN